MEDAKELLGQAIDSLENNATSLACMTTLPDRLHVEALRAALPEIVEKLKEGFVALTGENPWE